MTPQPKNRPKLTYKSEDSAFTSSEKSQMLAMTENKDLNFTFIYWDIASVGSTSRDILEYGKANYKNESPTDEGWNDGKVQTAFSVLPILKISGPNGKELFISESEVIDTFLAERFGLLGNNPWEALTICSFYSNIHYLRERCFSEVMVSNPKDRKAARDEFLSTTLRKFLEDHEFHLQENGNNGHYVGNKLSLADIHLWNVVHFFKTVPWGSMVLDAFAEYEAVWNVKENVEQLPELETWRSSALFGKYEENSRAWYAKRGVPEDVKEV
ncbi:hypothetical protein BG011_001011 [Mortierella polycephala]|uniref:Glutathione S-transferase n=1 Tax=Mortierella polycephala TaxID=41804 RepID=A0A9P6Q795_9FUNG|nr:hypothetical protein BG011_001011 [Mortierella polycephala]